jgi:hypothetical protein
MIQTIVRLTGVSPASSVFLMLCSATLAAQTPPDIARERADYLAWLTSAANSPLAAVAQQSIGDGVRLGPADADIPLAGIAEHRVSTDKGGPILEGPTGRRLLAGGRPARLGSYTLYLTSSPAGSVLTVFRSGSAKQPPGYYSYDRSLVFTGPLLPPTAAGKTRVLAADGMVTEASEAGSMVVPLSGGTRLRVLRIPGAATEESELEIFFRDGTNGRGSYPAGRFVSLVPLGGGKYRLDFNRARNPFCAYSTVYACPAPWRGNMLRVAVEAGERYDGGGLEVPSLDQEAK